MKYKLELAPLGECQSDVACVFVYSGQKIEDILADHDPAFGRKLKPFADQISQLCQQEAFKGKPGQSIFLTTFGHMKAGRLCIVGLGEAKDFKLSHARKAAANIVRRLPGNSAQTSMSLFFKQATSLPEKKVAAAKTAKRVSKTGQKSVGTLLDEAPSKSSSKAASLSTISDSDIIQAMVEGIILASYSFRKYKSSKNGDNKKPPALQTLSFAGFGLNAKAFAAATAKGEIIAESTNFARRLIAEPPSFMTPTKLAEEARAVAKEFGLTVKVLDAAQMQKLSMGAILGVARGAKEQPKFIVLSYDAPKSKRKVAIVGKGITFDSGGLSLKPAQSMEHMKYDMSGAAAVIATMRVVGTYKPNFSVMAVVAATENMPGDNALHPGDVISAMNGKTIEVNNTDAEGRLILADCLHYAVKEGADELIDIATLTGAVVTALGRVAAGIMGSDQQLIDKLIASGEHAGEKLWQLPMYDEYQESLKSDIADLKNAGARGEAGSASAAMFLKEFVSGKSWAHLDIAGPGWIDRDREECNKGGTGFGVRTLCQYLID